jgi:hypothetical protein
MTKPAASPKPKIPPPSPSTRSEPGPIEGRVRKGATAPPGRPREYDSIPRTARPAPSLATRPFDWRSD